jgi:hypothetical protein
MTFRSKKLKIITQNFNGPCSFIAICNILILRGDIEILPPNRTSVSYEFMSQLVGEYLLTHAPADTDLAGALNAMPLTQKGMDLNPLFTSPTTFRPTSTPSSLSKFLSGSPPTTPSLSPSPSSFSFSQAQNSQIPPELSLFKSVNITLAHGWLSDPSNADEHGALTRAGGDYDNAQNLIAAADYVSKGLLVEDESGGSGGGSSGGVTGYDVGQDQPQAGPSSAPLSNHNTFSESDRRKIQDAIAIRKFLDGSRSQLTYHGLFTLASMLEPGSLVALFRNEHLGVLYKPLPGEVLAVGAGGDVRVGGEKDVVAENGKGNGEGNREGANEVNDEAARQLLRPSSSHSSSSQKSAQSSSAPPIPSLQSQSHPSPAPLPPTPNPNSTTSLYTLVTDHAFYSEPTIVWERLEDVDGSSASFVDSFFERSTPVGGDWAGESVEGVLRRAMGGLSFEERNDRDLARQLQAEEDAQVALSIAQHQERQRAARQNGGSGSNGNGGKVSRRASWLHGKRSSKVGGGNGDGKDLDKDKNCVVM